jgi:hypothetical protein
MDLLILLISGFICGATNKYADLFNEHGLPQPFPYINILSGVIWGIAGSYLIYANSEVGLTYIAMVLYWFLRIKLEYFNHALAGVLMLLTAFYFQSEYIMVHKLELVCLFLGYTVTGYIQKYFKENTVNLSWFWKLRLRIYIVPLVYSIFINDFIPLLVTIIAMLGNEIVRYIYKDYENDQSILDLSYIEKSNFK